MFWFIPILLAPLIGGAVGAIVGWLLDEDSIADEIRAHEEFENGFKALIKSKSTRTVNLDIFTSNNTELGSIELTSDKGVSDNLYVGQTIYL